VRRKTPILDENRIARTDCWISCSLRTIDLYECPCTFRSSSAALFCFVLYITFVYWIYRTEHKHHNWYNKFLVFFFVSACIVTHTAVSLKKKEHYNRDLFFTIKRLIDSQSIIEKNAKNKNLLTSKKWSSFCLFVISVYQSSYAQRIAIWNSPQG